MQRHIKCLLRVLASGVLLLMAVRVHATDLRNVITDITITTWNEKDGLAASTIMALAQDADGYLWVGSRLGLLRFDGVRFAPWESFSAEPLPNHWVRSLLVTRHNALWIGFGTDGAVARVENGRVTSFTGERGIGSGSVLALLEDSHGIVWAGTDQGLFAFDGTRWTRWSGSRGVPNGGFVALFRDRADTLYAAGAAGLYMRRGETDGFERAGDFTDAYGGLAQGRDGAVWITDPRVGYHALGGAPVNGGSIARQGRGLRMLVDRKGNLWTGTGGQGLWRTHNPDTSATVERTSSLTGLLGDGVYSLLEDRDGNIWAGTTEGLNRITPRTIEQIIDLGLVRGVASEAEGRVWVTTVDKLFSYQTAADGRRTEIALPDDTRALAIDDRGFWVASGRGVSHVDRDGRESRLHWPGQLAAGPVDGLLVDHRAGLWLIADRFGIAHWTGGTTERLALPAPVQASKITAAFVDRRARAWFAFANGRVAVVTKDRVEALPELGSGGSKTVRAFAEDVAGRVWLGGDGILAAVDDAQVLALEGDRFPVGGVLAIVPDDRGSLWLGTPIGVVHLPVDEFDGAVANASRTPRYTVYNRSDGVAGTPVSAPFNGSAARTSDGRLWFVTTRGITVFDPHVLETHSASVPLRFEGAVADDHRLGPGGSLALAAGTRRLQIDYTVVNLTAPQKTRFRYRLDPFDHDWVDAGGRRQAFYTNLKPGAYVFRVAASGAGGEGGSEAVWPMTVAPMFYQTTTFAAMAVAAAGFLVLCGWQLRERHLRKQFSILIAERARLGREIHDTLLQGLVAIALQFDSLAHDLAGQPRLHDRFSRLRDRIEEYIREARRSIWDLHTQPPHRTLVESLRRAGEFATDGRNIAFTFQVQGTPCECPPRVEEQIVRIAQEASLNSVRHASPKQLRIDLAYDDAAVTLKVVDDGRGFDSRQVRPAGHLGIVSMQERARSVGGALTLVSTPGLGTEVTAVLPVAS